MRATCGHEVDEGISYTIEDRYKFEQIHGTYCSQCTIENHRMGIIDNKELIELIQICILLGYKEALNKKEAI
jgi:hypothetical protein